MFGLSEVLAVAGQAVIIAILIGLAIRFASKIGERDAQA